MSEADYEGSREMRWLLAPVVCVVVLTAGLFAGLLNALRQSGREEYGGIPLPNCQWLNSRYAVRVTAGSSLIAGLFGQATALRRFLRVWRGFDHAPLVLTILTLLAYSLLGAAVLLAGIGLRCKQQRPKAHEALRQAAKASLLGGLAAGLASEVLCNAGESEDSVPRDWRVGCAMLGASSGLFLLGLLAAQVDGQAQLPALERNISTDGPDVAGVGEEHVSHADGHMRLDSDPSAMQDSIEAPSSLFSRRWTPRGHPFDSDDHAPLRPFASHIQEPLLRPAAPPTYWPLPRDLAGTEVVQAWDQFGTGPLEGCREPFGAGLPSAPTLMVR